MTAQAPKPLEVRLSHATVWFTTRAGGVSQPPYDSLNLGPYVGDQPGSVERNLELLRTAAGLRSIHAVKQVHGARIIDCEDIPVGGGRPEADGMICSRDGEGLLVTVADCFPVAIATANRVAMLHCGWRPLAAGIVERAIDALGGAPFEAAIGPGIGAGAYEVGDEVAEAFGGESCPHFREGRLDLGAIIEDKLSAAERIERVEGCTHSDAERFFSHRRDGAPTGRQGGLAWRT